MMTIYFRAELVGYDLCFIVSSPLFFVCFFFAVDGDVRYSYEQLFCVRNLFVPTALLFVAFAKDILVGDVQRGRIFCFPPAPPINFVREKRRKTSSIYFLVPHRPGRG